MSDPATRLREVVAVNRAITSTLDYAEVLRLVVDKAAELTGAQACGLVVAGTDGRARLAASRGISEEAVADLDAPLDEQLASALRARLGFGDDDHFFGVPVIRHDQIEGLLLLYRRGDATALPEEELAVSALADQAAIALDHARRYGEAASARARQERLVDAMLDTTSVAIVYLDPELQLREANQAFRGAVGWLGRDLAGLTHPEIFPDHDVAAILRRVRADGAPVELKEVAVTRSGEPRRFWDWGARPVLGPDGRVEGLVVSAVDVTEAVETRRSLEQSGVAKDEFLAMLAHELRNPLAAIDGCVSLLELSRRDDDPRARHAVDAGRRQVRHMTRLLDDLLDVSRVTVGKFDLALAMLDLRDVARNAVEAMRGVVEARHHALEVRLPDDPVRVEGDPHRLTQVVSNLISNAAKYTEPGGHIEVDLTQVDDTAEIRVRDDGHGIREEILPHVFDLFVQDERPLGRTAAGLGVGLTISKRLVERHGGSIEARSAGAGLGSELIVRLPALPVSVPATLDEPATRSGPARPRRILVVDDNEDAAVMLAQLLESRGHELRVAADGPAAIRLAREWSPEVVVLDIGLPEIDGFEVARRIRTDRDAPQPHLVGLSGYARRQDRERAARAGFDAYFAKPVDIDALERAISEGP